MSSRRSGEAGIGEYWINNPVKRIVLVLALDKKTYQVHGKFKMGDQTTSKTLAGFMVEAGELFAEVEGG